MIAMSHHTEEKELVARGVRPDSKKRVSLGAALKDLNDASFNIYRDQWGCIILEPQVSIPASEAWLYRNKLARKSVERGLNDLAAGKVKSFGSFAKYAGDDKA